MSPVDPARAEAGRKGGRAKAAQHSLQHLTRREAEALYQLEHLARAYRTNTAGDPVAMAALIRMVADELEEVDA